MLQLIVSFFRYSFISLFLFPKVIAQKSQYIQNIDPSTQVNEIGQVGDRMIIHISQDTTFDFENISNLNNTPNVQFLNIKIGLQLRKRIGLKKQTWHMKKGFAERWYEKSLVDYELCRHFWRLYLPNSYLIELPSSLLHRKLNGYMNFDITPKVGVLGHIDMGMRIDISQETKASFDFENISNLNYKGNESEIIQNVDVPVN